MANTFRVHNCGEFIEVSVGQEFTVFRCGGGLSTFGEKAKLVRATESHLVFETTSGAIVKTNKGNLNDVVGKARKEGYNVTPRNIEGMIISKVGFWNEKKMCYETK